MKYKVEVELLDNINVVETRTKSLLSSESFEFKGSDQNKMVFVRGNIIRNYFTFNPSKWKTIITIQLSRISDQKTNLVADVEVTTKGQMVTAKEEEYWNNYVGSLKKSFEDNKDYLKDTKDLSKAALKKNWDYIKWAGIGLIIFLPIGMLIAYFTETTRIASSIAIIGVLGFMFYKINKDKKKDK